MNPISNPNVPTPPEDHSSPPTTSRRGLFAWAGATLAVAGTSGGVWAWLGREKTSDSEAVLNYLSAPGFTGSRFSRQILGETRLELLSTKEGNVYFVSPKADFDAGKHSAFLSRPGAIEQAEVQGFEQRIGNRKMLLAPNREVLWRTPTENFHIASDLMLTFRLRSFDYTISVAELGDYLRNSSSYGGRASIAKEYNPYKMKPECANHGAWVAKPAEPSLGRLVTSILNSPNSGPERTREEKAQRLLDFVTTNIRYQDTGGLSEVLMRANEVLMTASADCSGKTTLYASLLEQAGIDYQLLYTTYPGGTGHIAVALEKGAFSNRNGFGFSWNSKEWVVAETTVPGFRIGETFVSDSFKSTYIDYLQRPRDWTVFNYRTGKDAGLTNE